MRKLILTILLSSVILFVNGQNLTVEGTAPNQYIKHTVAPKENFYSVGRLYNQSPKTIAAYNNITLEKGLTIGQQIKIPAVGQNVKIDAANAIGADAIPLTHIVAKGETLFRISRDNNVTPQLIKTWNSLTTDNIAPGTPLIVGYMKMQDKQAGKETIVPEKTISAPVQQEQAIKQGQAISQVPVRDEPFTSVAPNEKTKQGMAAVESKQDTLIAMGQMQPVVKPGNLEAAPSATLSPAKENIDVSNGKEIPVKATESPEAKIENSVRVSPSTSPEPKPLDKAFSDVYGSNSASKSVSYKSGEAATFKSTSGWQDKKYYVLINNVQPGTILKIEASDNKYIYAKVLGSMPEMKENNGLLLRVSNAAASSLGIIDPRFPVQVSYY